MGPWEDEWVEAWRYACREFRLAERDPDRRPWVEELGRLVAAAGPRLADLVGFLTVRELRVGMGTGLRGDAWGEFFSEIVSRTRKRRAWAALPRPGAVDVVQEGNAYGKHLERLGEQEARHGESVETPDREGEA